jgi:hypothetical protein
MEFPLPGNSSWYHVQLRLSWMMISDVTGEQRVLTCVAIKYIPVFSIFGVLFAICDSCSGIGPADDPAL